MERTQYGTPYLETEAILAAQNDDPAALESILRTMYSGELSKLREAAEMVVSFCTAELHRPGRQEA